MKPKDIFLAKINRAESTRAAIGSATSIVTTDLTQEAGVGFPEAHLVAEKMAHLASTGHTVLGFDNVMPLFSVWHESEALGCRVDWGDSGQMPDGRPVYTSITDEIHIPDDLLKRPGCAVPLDALRLLKKRWGNDVAVVGKVFGPWTLGYHIFGVEEFLMSTLLDPDSVKDAMRTLIDVTIAFANAQIDSGADALTLGDHCTRDLCSPDAYRDFLTEVHQELHERIPCPLILHICGDTSDRLKYIRQTGIECFHFDSKVPAADARALAGNGMSLMGGTSNIDIIRNGTPDAVESDIREKLDVGIDIIGPECAVPLDAPYRNLKTLVQAALELGGTRAQGKEGAENKENK